MSLTIETVGKIALSSVSTGLCGWCDGRKGQQGFCCRGDGFRSYCDSNMLSELVNAGQSHRHYCIYDQNANVEELTILNATGTKPTTSICEIKVMGERELTIF